MISSPCGSGSRHLSDGLENARGDLIGIALGIRTAVFEVAFVAAVDEAVGHADRGAAVGQAVGELVNRLSFVEAGQTQVVVWAVNCDVFFHVFSECCHEGFEVFLAAFFTQVVGGKVGVHAGAIPVTADWLAVVFHVDAVFFAEAVEDVASHPNFVGALFGAFAEDLEFPLAFGDFGIDAFVVDAGVEAEVEVFFDDLACDIADGFVAGTAVIWALRGGVSFSGETEWAAILIEEIFLLETKPCARIIEHGGAAVGWVRGGAVWHHDFAHHKSAVAASAVWIDGDWFEHAVGAAAFGLLRRAAIKSPHRQLFESWKAFEFLDLGFSAEVRNGRVAVEPDVFQFVFGHMVGLVVCCWW